MFFFVWFFVPETKGVSLEAMDELFGVVDVPEKSTSEGEAREKEVPRAKETEVA